MSIWSSCEPCNKLGRSFYCCSRQVPVKNRSSWMCPWRLECCRRRLKAFECKMTLCKLTSCWLCRAHACSLALRTSRPPVWKTTLKNITGKWHQTAFTLQRFYTLGQMPGCRFIQYVFLLPFFCGVRKSLRARIRKCPFLNSLPWFPVAEHGREPSQHWVQLPNNGVGQVHLRQREGRGAEPGGDCRHVRPHQPNQEADFCRQCHHESRQQSHRSERYVRRGQLHLLAIDHDSVWTWRPWTVYFCLENCQ